MIWSPSCHRIFMWFEQLLLFGFWPKRLELLLFRPPDPNLSALRPRPPVGFNLKAKVPRPLGFDTLVFRTLGCWHPFVDPDLWVIFVLGFGFLNIELFLRWYQLVFGLKVKVYFRVRSLHDINNIFVISFVSFFQINMNSCTFCFLTCVIQF